MMFFDGTLKNSCRRKTTLVNDPPTDRESDSSDDSPLPYNRTSEMEQPFAQRSRLRDIDSKYLAGRRADGPLRIISALL